MWFMKGGSFEVLTGGRAKVLNIVQRLVLHLFHAMCGVCWRISPKVVGSDHEGRRQERS